MLRQPRHHHLSRDLLFTSLSSANVTLLISFPAVRGDTVGRLDSLIGGGVEGSLAVPFVAAKGGMVSGFGGTVLRSSCAALALL